MSLLREKITALYHADETTCVQQLLTAISFPSLQQTAISAQAARWINKIRSAIEHSGQLNTLLVEYSLSTEEGVALMVLAESLLRVPDTYNVDKLIEEQLTAANWQAHLGSSSSHWVNAATWGLLLSGKILAQPENTPWLSVWQNLLRRMGKPMVRRAIKAALRAMGQQFVLAETMDKALASVALKKVNSLELFSFDMLGEAACTADDAEKYYQDYLAAIKQLAQENWPQFAWHNPGISIKLSALHPRFEFTQQERLRQELLPRLLQLAEQAKQANIHLTIDAEEAVRLDITLDLFAALCAAPTLQEWNGLGLAVQAYQKRAPAVVDWLIELAQHHQRRIPVRLVKGAYWDSEIKYAQERGYHDYPVYTRKQTTDVCYFVCAKKLLAAKSFIYPQFGTHNAYTVAAILSLAENNHEFEWQRLQGMGENLYTEVLQDIPIPCRVYAPVGKYEVLLPYLARRLLENGANSSFVHQIGDVNIPIETLIQDPITAIQACEFKRHPAIPLPRQMYPERLSAKAIDFSDRAEWQKFTLPNAAEFWATRNRHLPESTDIAEAINRAVQVHADWNATAVAERAACLLRAADLLEQHMPELIALLTHEGGKTLLNAQAEVRETVDYCRYYAQQALKLFTPEFLPGPTGESNCLTYQGRGAIVCISPWNFPLAIFLGQVTAALVTGNTVLAKPAEQTPLIAKVGVELLHTAGIPSEVLQLIVGRGETVGAQLVSDPRIAGVIFTGSTQVARSINQTLAARQGPIVPFIAETGGLNAMLVDSTALLEQAVQDTLISAFDSAGQRCSAARIVLVQEEIADRFLALLKGAMAELVVGDPSLLNTDIGPVIDADALLKLQKHQAWLDAHAQWIGQTKIVAQGELFFAPCAYELASVDEINQEVFGPILHVVRYTTQDLSLQLAKLQAKGYGLTFGMHTRLNQQAEVMAQQLSMGNIYINRSMIGAVVGTQPFGGCHLSGTGPKAGGPHYLTRLVNEKVVSINLTVAGGNAHLMTLK